MKSDKNLLQGNVRKTFYRYLIPGMSATIMLSANYFIDTLCIGQKLGEEGLAALNLAWPITTVLYALGYLMGAGSGARYSAYMARGEKDKAKGIYTGALLTLVVIGLMITAAAVVFIDPLVTLLGGTGSIRSGVTDYVFWVVIFAIAYMADCFYTSILRNDGTPKLSMAATLMACMLNIVLDIMFVWVFDWGMAGASLATSLAVTTSTVFGVLCTLRKKSGLKLNFAYLKIQEIVRTAKVGMSAFLTEVDSGLVTFVYNMVLIRIAGGESTTAVAVYGIVVNVNTIVLAAITGITNSLQPLVSASFGAGLKSRAKQFLSEARKFALVFTVLVVAFIEWKAELIVTFFLEPGDAFLSQAAGAVRIVAASYLLASINMLTVSYFQAIQSFVHASWGSILRTLLLPVVFVISGAALFDVAGVWFASVCIEVTTAVILWFMYQRVQKNTGMIKEGDVSYE